MGFTNTFGGSSVSPADVAYAAYSFSVNPFTLYWPQFSAGQTNIAARFMNLNATTTGLNVYMPDATLASVGYDAIIFNAGSNSFNVVGFSGTSIVTIAPNQTYYLMLNGNATQNGSWQTVQFGVGTGSTNASALAGSGLAAVAGLLQLDLNGNNVSSNFNITSSDLAQLYIWTGGSGIITLPAAASVGNGFFFMVANNGSGSLTLTPSGTIDGASTSVFSQTQSGFIFSNGVNWFTVGKGIQNTFSVTLLNLNVSGSSNVTETSAQAQNIIQVLTGVLTGNISVIVPATVQLYEINNSTTGAYSLTVRTAAGTGIVVPQGQTTILYCDGTNVVNGLTTSVTSVLSLVNGSAISPSLSFAASPSSGFFSPGTGLVSIAATADEVFRFSSQASSVNYFGAVASASGSALALGAVGTDSNININIIPKGTGYVSTGLLDNTVIGSNVAAAASFTNLAASGTVSGAGFTAYLASPPAIGGSVAAAVTGTTVTAATQFNGAGTGLTGTAASLSIGGTAATATNATNATNVGITDDTSTNATMYPTWVTANTGNLPEKTSSTKLSFNPSTGALAVVGLNASGLTASELVATDSSKNLVSITALPNGTTATTQSARDSSTKVATTAYADGASHFGLWTLGGFIVNTAYLAATDGFVLAYVGNDSSNEYVQISGITDSNAAPTTTVIANVSLDTTLGGSSTASITFPVRKGDYWKVTTANTGQSPNINWLPMGN